MNLEKRISALELFQTKFKSDCNKSFTQLAEDKVELRINMYDEEAEEFLKAHRLGDKVEELDAICDELFLTIGDAVSFGIQDKLKLHSHEIFYFSSPKSLTLMSMLYADDLRNKLNTSIIDSCNARLNRIKAKSVVLYGENADEILDLAMTVVEESNMSKLGDDGEPIINTIDSEFYDSNKPLNKILKNPKTYFTPTERLTKILKDFNVI